MVGSVQLVLLAMAVVGVGEIIAPQRLPAHFATRTPPGPPHEPPGPPPGPAPGRPSPVTPLLTFFFSGLAIVGVGSFLTARWIVRPLETLSKAARSLGAGDLNVRAGLTRSDELGEVGRAFDEMAGRMQGLLLAERELMANVSHELRTPLARIRVALDLAGEADGAAAARASLAEIQEDLAEIEALIDDILTTTRLDIQGGRAPTGRFELHVESVGPGLIGERSSARFGARHPRRPLEVTVDERLPLIQADPGLLRRVIDNLLENADKYSPDPGAPIMLRVTSRNDSVIFEVEDRGVGIHADDLPSVFTPFFRGERSRSRGTGGVGLGLTLAKRIVDAHRGQIDVRSAVGQGTTVRVTLPLGVAR